MSNLVALLIVTNLVCKPCPYCNVRPEGMNLPPGVVIYYPVVHEHQYEAVVTTNYLPVVEMPAKEEIPAYLDPTNWVIPDSYMIWDKRKVGRE